MADTTLSFRCDAPMCAWEGNIRPQGTGRNDRIDLTLIRTTSPPAKHMPPFDAIGWSPGHRKPQGNVGRGPDRTRLAEPLAACVLAALAAPIVLLAALAIRIESRGPVLFRQTRVGLNGQPFRMLKLRSMRCDAEADGIARWATANDPRVTRVGRFLRRTRIDELPQLLNVIRGDMSLVGPRPERPDFVDTLSRELRGYALRHSVRPGITGLAQVRLRYAASVADSAQKLSYDLKYIADRTLWLDLRILGATVRVVFTGAGAH